MTSDDVVARHVARLIAVFRENRDKQQAHRKSKEILGALASDPSTVGSILRTYLLNSAVLNNRHYPVIGITLEENVHFTLVANCWLPLPDRSSDVSTKSIHHHGTMLLTTATAFGPGYEHWTFTRPIPVGGYTELFRFTVIESGNHGLHHVAFVDSYIAHVPLYPSSLSITLALWSDSTPTDWRAFLKRLPVVRNYTDELRRVSSFFGLGKMLNIKAPHYFDFYPTQDGFKGLKTRKEFVLGPNEDYLHSLFHVLQITQNEHLSPSIRNHIQTDSLTTNTPLIRTLINDLESGRAIESKLSTGHHGIATANFRREEIKRALMVTK